MTTIHEISNAAMKEVSYRRTRIIAIITNCLSLLFFILSLCFSYFHSFSIWLVYGNFILILSAYYIYWQLNKLIKQKILSRRFYILFVCILLFSGISICTLATDLGTIYNDYIRFSPVPILLFWVITSIFYGKKGQQILTNIPLLYLFIFSFIVLNIIGGIVFFNIYFDQSKPTIFVSPIIRKNYHTHTRSGNHYSLYYQPWGRFTGLQSIDVSKNEYDSAAVGDSLYAFLYHGRLNIQWYKIKK